MVKFRLCLFIEFQNAKPTESQDFENVHPDKQFKFANSAKVAGT